MNNELFSRREKLVSRISMGISITDAAADIASGETDPAKRQRLYQATIRDWNRRDTWFHKYVRIFDETYVMERVASMERAVKFSYREYAHADKPKDRNASLRTVLMGDSKILDTLTKTRTLVVHPPPEKPLPPMTLPFEMHPVIAEQYKRLREEQMREKMERENQSQEISHEQNMSTKPEEVPPEKPRESPPAEGPSQNLAPTKSKDPFPHACG